MQERQVVLVGSLADAALRTLRGPASPFISLTWSSRSLKPREESTYPGEWTKIKPKQDTFRSPWCKEKRWRGTRRAEGTGLCARAEIARVSDPHSEPLSPSARQYRQKGRPTSQRSEDAKSPKWRVQSSEPSGSCKRESQNMKPKILGQPAGKIPCPLDALVYFPTKCEQSLAVPRTAGEPITYNTIQQASQIVLGVRELEASMTSSRWLHRATNRSKNSLPPSPPLSISACMVPLLLKVLRHRMMSAR